MKYSVTISRKWNKPEIKTMVFACHEIDEDIFIRLEVSLENFLEALKEEIGPVTWIFTQEKFNSILKEASNRVIEEIKKESVKVVAT
jgi:hypothetical protein